MKESCETCRWWGAELSHNNDTPYGTCRVNPPVALENVTIIVGVNEEQNHRGVKVRKGVWPWTAFDDSCGAYGTKITPSTKPAPPRHVQIGEPV